MPRLPSQLFGAENVYRTSRGRGRLEVPKLLAQTREEEAAARKAGMNRTAPKNYQFIKESLDALEAQHAAKELAAREQAYERNRRRLQLGRTTTAEEEEDVDDEGEIEDLRTRLSKMSEEEFKQLAMERKKRAQADLEQRQGADGPPTGGASDESGSTSKPSRSQAPREALAKPSLGLPQTSARESKRGGSAKRAPLDPKDDPDCAPSVRQLSPPAALPSSMETAGTLKVHALCLSARADRR